MFDTKIAIVLREDLALWQKLNVTAFLTSGLVGGHEGILGLPYEDAEGRTYHALIVQPIIVLSASAEVIGKIHRRATERDLPTSLFIDEMFRTPHDVANRAAMRGYRLGEPGLAGIAMRERRAVVDKVTQGARMHD